jgi:hypothetical protein
MGKTYGEVNAEHVEIFDRSVALLCKMKNVSQAEALTTLSEAMNMPVDDMRAFFTEGTHDEIERRMALMLSDALRGMYGDDDAV